MKHKLRREKPKDHVMRDDTYETPFGSPYKRMRTSGCAETSNSLPRLEIEFPPGRKRGRRMRRNSVSAECGTYQMSDISIQPQITPKSPTTARRVLGVMKNSVIFSSITEREQNTLLSCMVERNMKAGEVVFEEGNCLNCRLICGSESDACCCG